MKFTLSTVLLKIFDSKVAGDSIPVAPSFNPSPVVGTTKLLRPRLLFLQLLRLEKARTKKFARLATFGSTAYISLTSGLLQAGPIALCLTTPVDNC